MNTKQLLKRFAQFGFTFSLNPDGVYEIKKHGQFYCFAQSKTGLRRFIEQFEQK